MTEEYNSLVNSSNYEKIRSFLNRKNFDGFTVDDLFIIQFFKKGWGQDIAALSNMAQIFRTASVL